MATRSVQATFVNQTSQQLVLVSSNAQHGDFSPAPPPVINGNSSATFGMQSNITGVQGSVNYSLPGGVVSMSWDDPLIGTDNIPNATAPSAFSIETVASAGNNATVTYTLSNA